MPVIFQLKAEFLEEQEIYRKRLEEFYDAHPDVAPSKGPTNATQKGTSGLAFFIAERLKDPRNSDVSSVAVLLIVGRRVLKPDRHPTD